MPIIQKPWTKHKITASNSATLSEVYHVAHVDTAIRILKDQKIKAGLVYDNSKLNTERISVTWFSPNKWGPGFRYGNVGFCYLFKDCVKKKNIYWVEEMVGYNPVACRFLITQKKYENLKMYDPSRESEPLIYNSSAKQYLWNSEICLELMFEEDFEMNKCFKMLFLDHHAVYCCIDPKTCKDLKLGRVNAGERFFSFVLAHDLTINSQLLTITSGKRVRSGELYASICGILGYATRHITYIGTQVFPEEVGKSIVQAAMVHIANGDLALFRKVISIFKGYEDFSSLFLQIVQHKLGLTNVREFDD